MKNLRALNTAGIILVFCAATAMVAPAKTNFNVLTNLDGATGDGPEYVSLVQGLDGNFYGTASIGGANSQGTVFVVTPKGTLNVLYSFCAQTNCTDGERPYAGLVLAANGNLYGTTYEGGASTNCPAGCGTVFEITPKGKLTTLYSFCLQTGCPDGAYPYGTLVLGANGNFYGTTGDISDFGPTGNGKVFEITLGGKLTTLHSFGGTDGSYPYGTLVLAANGNFYGTTTQGGSSSNCLGGCGTVFEITPGGKLTSLHSFVGTDGQYPYGGLVQATNGNFYGTTEEGGSNNVGTVFEITAKGKLTTPHNFADDATDGGFSTSGPLQATNGNLYGMTAQGGGDTDGTVFEITPGGKPTLLHSFNGTHGNSPAGGLLQATNGTFYGLTASTVFSLSVGLKPFVETLPASAKVGVSIIILGNKLTGATGVTFNGTAAPVFKVVSATEIKVMVPTGATSGTVEVTTPSGTLKSNVAFQVKP